ncbi:MAG: methionyl-tRNA formyltransferase [Clostridia bacterium]|nr:methionyl-tRNA formyltransferase [Clostridia bacterium]
MRILFMGTPDFARSILEKLHTDGEDIVAVVTQPDKPWGRKQVLTPPPVKQYALEKNLPVYQPVTLKDGAFAEELSRIDPELIIVAAYGKILPKYILDYPKYGCINAHGSILPRWRGAAPIQHAIMAGDTVSGVTAMYMAQGLDTGDMILTVEVPITDEDDFGTLHDKLAVAGGNAMAQTIARLRDGTITREVQNDANATYAAKIENADCVIDFTKSVTEIYNQVRGLSPVPLAVTWMPDGKRLKIIAAQREICAVTAAPSTVIDIDHGTLDIACGDGILHVTQLQPEGKGRMAAADFLRGRKLSVGDVLHTPAS